MRVTQLVLLSAVLVVAQLSSRGAALTRGPYLQSCTTTSIVVRWRTDDLTDTRVTMRTTNSEPEIVYQSESFLLDHEVQIRNLKPGTRYNYTVGSSSETLASGTNCYIRTHPTNAQPVRVWAIGDSGDGSIGQTAVRDSYLRHSNSALTDVWLMLGDNVYGYADDGDYQGKLFDIYSGLLAHTPLWPALGNHDAPFGTPYPYLDIFTLPQGGEAGGVQSRSELYYSFDFANVHFVCLDSWLTSRSSNAPMCNWLRADLAATTQDWIIVYWHHPPYSMGTDFSDSTPILIEMREQVVPILESFGVDLVLSGHSHVYERSYLINGHYGYSWTFNPTNAIDAGFGRPGFGGAYTKPAAALGANRGTIYVVCGNSGQGGPVNFQRHPAMAQTMDQYGSVVLDIDGLKLNAKYLRPNGAIDDYFTIDKSVPSTAAVPLTVQKTRNVMSLNWPVTMPSTVLEFSSDLSGTNWLPAPWPMNRWGRTNRMNFPCTNPAGFFRLRSITN